MKAVLEIVILSFILILVGFFTVFYILESKEPSFDFPIKEREDDRNEEIVLREKAEEKTGRDYYIPEIYLSSDKLEQGDTLLIRVNDKTGINKVNGEFGSKKINFFKLITTKDWIAIVGIGVKKEPGQYNLNINFLNDKFEKDLTVIKRNFPVTKLLVTDELEEKGYTPLKIAKNIVDKDNPKIQEVLQIYTPAIYFTQPFIYPLEKIEVTGDYGNIRESKDITLQHLGVDIDAPTGTPVYAVNDGAIRFSEDLINYGKTIIIDHGFGIYSLYLHLDMFKTLSGERVKQGDIIGFSGNTGYSIVPHLHFSMKVNRESVDPLRFIKLIQEEIKGTNKF